MGQSPYRLRERASFRVCRSEKLSLIKRGGGPEFGRENAAACDGRRRLVVGKARPSLSDMSTHRKLHARSPWVESHEEYIRPQSNLAECLPLSQRDPDVRAETEWPRVRLQTRIRVPAIAVGMRLPSAGHWP
jgi:hypothetical protein